MKPLRKDSLVAKQYPEHRVVDPRRLYFPIAGDMYRAASSRSEQPRIFVEKARAGERYIIDPEARSSLNHPCCDVRVGSGATRTKVLPKFSPRSISAKAVGITSNPSRISSRYRTSPEATQGDISARNASCQSAAYSPTERFRTRTPR